MSASLAPLESVRALAPLESVRALAYRGPMSEELRRLHAKIGWWGLFGSVLVGLVLEGLLAWKRPEIVDPGVETRRLLFRLAHAHAGILSLVHLAFASLAVGASREEPRAALSSKLLLGGSVLLPLGFLLGGAFLHGGDPGAGILFVPIGAAALLGAFFLAARAVR